jgi:hypothetical protein
VAEDSAAIQPAGSERVTGPSGPAYHARVIETIRTGQRVLARNPQLAEEGLPDSPVDPASWVNIHLRMPKPTGDHLEITLLRPVEWLAEHLAQAAMLDGEYAQTLDEAREVGADLAMPEIRSVIVSDEEPLPTLGHIRALDAHQTPTPPWVFLTLHELEAVGPAEVLQVEPCPPIEPGAGRLVTGTFAHQSGEVFDITVDGLTAPIGCTGAHPFWSEDRQDFVPARALVPGETLRTESGTLRQITRITPRRGPPVSVFNLEVDAEHVYYVSVDGVLVHNAYDLQEFTGGRYRGGSHADMSASARRGDGLDSHHMPDRYADPNTPCGDGPAIQMDPADHHATSSNGRHGLAAARFRAKTAELIAKGKYRDAMAREIWDVRRAALEVSGDRTKYNEAIREMLEFARSSGQLPGK